MGDANRHSGLKPPPDSKGAGPPTAIPDEGWLEVPDDELLTIPEAALALGRSGPTIRRYIAQGFLPVVQIGGPGHAVRIRRDDLEKVTESRPRAAA